MSKNAGDTNQEPTFRNLRSRFQEATCLGAIAFTSSLVSVSLVNHLAETRVSLDRAVAMGFGGAVGVILASCIMPLERD